MEHDQTLDICGLCCAEPIIRITKEMKSLAKGEMLLVVSDKSSMENDIPAYCRQTGNALVYNEDVHGQLRFWIRKG
ncbi:MAG TPA: sulfurtransferase TusA family protein [Burkholderiales bacterium]|nr:sulfurtransferase TusA family protein [Burkholderiales bacterium]